MGRRSRRRRAALAAAALAAGAWALCAAPAATAHALLRSSDPADGQEISAPPAAITLSFTEPPEPSLSEIRVLGPGGNEVHGGRPEAVPGDPGAIRLTLPPLEKAAYTVTWHVVSRVDGHPSAGTFAFGVGVSPLDAPRPRPPAPAPASPLEVAARAALFLGLGVLLGAGWVGALAFARPPGRVVALAAAAAGLALAATAVLGVVQARAAGTSLGGLAGTAVGRALALRAAGAVAALAALAMPGRARRWGLLAAGVAASAAMLAHVGAGHAAAERLGPTRVAAQWMHVVAAGVWLGGLAALLVGIRGEPAEPKAAAVRRFSAVAGVALAAVLITGVLRAVDEVSGWGPLWSSAYGRLVVAKGALLVGLAGLGATNRWRNVPAASRSLGGLRRVSRGELTLGAGALIAAGAMASLVPPAGVPAIAGSPAPVAVEGSDPAAGFAARLGVVPGLPGDNRFTVRLTELGSGDPLDGARVTLRFSAVGRPEVPPSTLALRDIGEGSHEGSGVNLSLPGPWEATVQVRRGAELLEVPLRLATICRTEEVEAPPRPTVHLHDAGEGRTVEGYLLRLDGALHEIHFTFLADDGREIPIPEPPGILVSRAGAAASFVDAIPLGPGHFTGEAELPPGPWRFDTTAKTKGGSTISGCFEETLAP